MDIILISIQVKYTLPVYIKMFNYVYDVENYTKI